MHNGANVASEMFLPSRQGLTYTSHPRLHQDLPRQSLLRHLQTWVQTLLAPSPASHQALQVLLVLVLAPRVFLDQARTLQGVASHLPTDHPPSPLLPKDSHQVQGISRPDSRVHQDLQDPTSPQVDDIPRARPLRRKVGLVGVDLQTEDGSGPCTSLLRRASG